MPILINAINRDGQEEMLEATPGDVLMDVLRNKDLVDAICGGAASCGTCHVYINEGWVEKLGDRTEDEGYMLEALEEIVEVRKSSRLACQITLSQEHSGISFKIAPDA